MRFRIESATEEHRRSLVRLFEAANSPCYCRFWHFEGTTNDWLARCVSEDRENQREFENALVKGSDEARGLVALTEAHEVVGWMKVVPALSVPKMHERRFYKQLPCLKGDRSGVFSIGCFLIHPEWRRQGISTKLVAKAVEIAPTWGARELEALPRRPNEPVSDEEMFMGPVKAFLDNGFAFVDTFAPYPVLRRSVEPV